MERYVLRGFLVHTYYLPVLGSNLVSHPGGRSPNSDFLSDILIKVNFVTRQIFKLFYRFLLRFTIFCSLIKIDLS